MYRTIHLTRDSDNLGLIIMELGQDGLYENNKMALTCQYNKLGCMHCFYLFIVYPGTYNKKTFPKLIKHIELKLPI